MAEVPAAQAVRLCCRGSGLRTTTFGGHVVVVAGYDPDTGQVLVADRDRDLHPVGWEALEQARGSRYKPFPPPTLASGESARRYMYARFLDEAASITGEPRLKGMGTELTGIGDRWERVAAAFAAAAQADHPADLLETATEPMHEIADLEQDFWERLSTMIAA